MIILIMAGYPSNLAKKFSPTEQFPRHILPLLPLYNAQWWGYESLTAIVLVFMTVKYLCCESVESLKGVWSSYKPIRIIFLGSLTSKILFIF